MKSLYLLRHARSLEKQNDQEDIDRELTSIGLQNSTRMGINFAKKKIVFDIIISSPAVRAKTTGRLIAEQMKYDTNKIHYNPEIYEASIRTLLGVVNKSKNEWKNVLLIGHNPSVSYLAEYVTRAEIVDMTTCGVVKIDLSIKSWEEVSEGNGKFVFYEYPDLLNF